MYTCTARLGSYSTGLPVLGSSPGGPVEPVHVLVVVDELTRRAVEVIEEAVPREVGHDGPHLAIDLDVDQHVDAVLVEVPGLVGNVLVVPRHRPVIDVEGEHGVREQVVARTELGVEHRHRVPGPPDRDPLPDIVLAGRPHAAAAGLPRVVVVQPRLVAGLTRPWNGVEAPQLLAGRLVQRGQPSAGGGIAESLADEDLALDRQRSRGELLLPVEIPLDAGAGDLLVPHDLAGTAADRDDAAIDQVVVDHVSPEGETACAGAFVLADCGVCLPQDNTLPSVGDVDLIGRPPTVGQEHHPVVDQGTALDIRVLPRPHQCRGDRHREHRPQPRDVFLVDLVQPRITVRPIILKDRKPVLRLAVCILKPDLCYVCRARRQCQHGGDCTARKRSKSLSDVHCFLPISPW